MSQSCVLRLLGRMPLAMVLSAGCLWLPAKADIFITSGNKVISYSEFIGAQKLTITSPLQYPEGLTIGPDGNLYVADCGTKTVERFNPATGAHISTFVSPIGGSSCPFGITFGPDGNLYMADNLGFIRSFAGSTGAPIYINTCSAANSGTPCYPVDLAFGPDGNLYVSDSGGRGVLKFDSTGSLVLQQFVPPFPGLAFPWGLHFGVNGNLYVVFSFSATNSPYYYNEILEYDGGSGAPIAFAVPYSYTGQSDFAFGLDSSIYVAGSPSFTRYSSSSGVLLSTFGFTGLSPASQPGFIAIGGPCGFICAPPPILVAPIGLDATQTLRMTVVNGPVPVGPGVPVEAQLGFTNSAGQPVGPSQVVSLNPGQTASLDLAGSSLISSGRIEIVPVATTPAGVPWNSLQGSVEIFNPTNGIASAFSPGISVVSSIAGYPSFVPQGVARGQSIQINALAPPDSSCNALLSFTDSSGNPVGPSQQVSLNPGTMASLSFNTNPYTKSGRAEFVPQIRPINTINTNGVQTNSACIGSVEVYVQKSGSTSTYQMSSPVIGVTTAVP